MKLHALVVLALLSGCAFSDCAPGAALLTERDNTLNPKSRPGRVVGLMVSGKCI